MRDQVAPQAFVAAPLSDVARGRLECQVDERAVAALGGYDDGDAVLGDNHVRASICAWARVADQKRSGLVERCFHEVAQCAEGLQIGETRGLDRQQVGRQRAQRALPRGAAHLDQQPARANPYLDGFELFGSKLGSGRVVDDHAVEAAQQLGALWNRQRIERCGPCTTDRWRQIQRRQEVIGRRIAREHATEVIAQRHARHADVLLGDELSARSVYEPRGQAVVGRVGQVHLHGERAVAQARQHHGQRERGRHEAIRAATARLLDDDFYARFELAALVDELDVQRHPATDPTSTIESGPHVHAHGSRRGLSVLIVRRGGDRLHTSQKEAQKEQNP